MFSSQRSQTALNRVLQGIVVVYQIIAAIVFIAGLYKAYDWLKNPFIGGFFEHTFVLNGSDTSEEGQHWAMYEQGFKLGDQLVSVDNREVFNSGELMNILGSHMVGDVVPVEMRTSDGLIQKTSITLSAFSAGDQVAYFILPTFLSLVFLIVSLWIFGLRRTEPAGRAFSIFTASLAITIGSLFDLYTSHTFTRIWTMAAGVSGGALIDLVLGFPQEVRFVIGRPYLRWVGYLAGVLLALNAYGTLFISIINRLHWRLAGIHGFIGLSALFYFIGWGYHAFFSRSPVAKSQAPTILIGFLGAIWACCSGLLFKGNPLTGRTPIPGKFPHRKWNIGKGPFASFHRIRGCPKGK